jgi:hypothetical protein
MYKIPQTNQFSSLMSSDRVGNIYRTKNISFDKEGYIKLGKRTRSQTNSVILADFISSSNTVVNAIVPFQNELYILSNNSVYQAFPYNLPAFVKNVETNSPALGFNSDAVVFNGRIYVARDSGAPRYSSGGAWTILTAASSWSVVTIFKDLNQIAGATSSTVELFNTSDVKQKTLTIPSAYSVTSMAWASNRLWIGTRASEGTAILIEWDGVSDAANNIYETDCEQIFSVKSYREGVVCAFSDGRLMYNRGGWQELGKFPFVDQDKKVSLFVQKNGMAVEKDRIYIGVNNTINDNTSNNTPVSIPEFPAGIYCFDPKVGIYHAFSMDNSLTLRTNAITTGNVNTSTDIITVAGVTVPETGTPVYYYNAQIGGSADTSSATPLKHNTQYWTIKQSDTTLKLASSYANALSNTAIDLTGTGNNNQYLQFNPVDAFGGTRDFVTAIALFNVNISINNGTSDSKLVKMMIGGGSADSAGTTRATISVVAENQENRAEIITPKFESQDLTEEMLSCVIKHKPLSKPEDKIVVKYRNNHNTLEDYETIINSSGTLRATFVNGNSYTTTADLSQVAIGDEVTFTRGKGAGFTAHITNLSLDTGTWTVTLDETIPNMTAGNISYPFYSQWKKIATFTSESENNSKGYSIAKVDETSTWHQFKIELRGYDIEIQSINAVNNENLPYKQ